MGSGHETTFYYDHMGKDFSEKFVPTIGQPHERKPVTTKDLSGVYSCISREMNDCFS